MSALCRAAWCCCEACFAVFSFFLHACLADKNRQGNCSFFSESLDTTPFESHRATSLEGGLRDPDATSQEDPAQLRRSLFPAMLELTEQIHTPWLEATLSGHGPDEIRCLYRSFYTEPLDLETGDPATEGGCPEAAAAEWPPAKSHKALRTIAEDATSTPPGTKMFHQHSDVQTARGDDDDLSLDRSLSAVAVLRHGERQDSIWGSAWHNTEDSHRHPGDCPISDQAILEARNVAHLLGDFGDFGIIVSSPYLRCVQTAIAIAVPQLKLSNIIRSLPPPLPLEAPLQYITKYYNQSCKRLFRHLRPQSC